MDPLDFSDAGPCEPGDEEWLRRRDLFLADDTDSWMWLSFVDPDKSDPPGQQVPGGGGFLGIAIVPGGNIVQAAMIAGMFGCNPGGEVGGYRIPGVPREQYRCRLIPRDEALEVAKLDLDELCE